MNQLTEYDKTRYGRQMMLEGWGEEGQARLKQSTVFIAGAGGLGSPVSMYLAAAGIGHLRLADLDALELSNLNRQILYTDADVGSSKAERAGHSVARTRKSRWWPVPVSLRQTASTAWPETPVSSSTASTTTRPGSS